MTAELTFDGEAFDPTDLTATGTTTGPETAPEANPEAVEAPVRTLPGAPAAGPAGAVARLRHQLVTAHHQALATQELLQRRLLSTLPGGTGTTRRMSTSTSTSTNTSTTSSEPTPTLPPVPAPPTSEGAFKPLARTRRASLDAGDLDRLAAGELAAVLGPEYDQLGANPELRLRPGRVARLRAIEGLSARGGAAGRGGADATLGDVAVDGPISLADAAVEAAEALALVLGLHLSLPDTTLTGAAGEPVLIGDPEDAQTLRLDVTVVDLVPRPHLVARAVLRCGDEVIGWVRDVTVRVEERPGAPIGPDADGLGPALGRVTPDGEPALLGEFHMAHIACGDLGIGLGAPFARFTERRATRLPSHGLLLVDRVVAMDGVRGRLDGARYTTEYDVPDDAWYLAETGNADVPNFVLMETSLQSALLGGYHLGATLTDPDQDYSLRNLGGAGTLLREIDLPGRTIRQESALTSTTPMPGSILQEFTYTLAVDGEPYYEGSSMFGYFTAQTLANQTGLDGGRPAPTWLEEQPTPPATRTLDVAGRRTTQDGPRPPRGHLALLDTVTVVDGGGRDGQGYLHVARAVDPDDWFFARHFHLDPVVPGSLGVEQIVQAMQEWAVDAGLADGLTAPEFVVPVGVELSWRYRGQVVPTDGVTTLEVHLTGVERRPGRVRVTGEASLWKPGLRIYELTGATVELRERGAQPW